MSGKIPNNYEESKQWIDVFNVSETDEIRAFCPCALGHGLDAGASEGLPIIAVFPLNQYERVEHETGFYDDSSGARPVAICGAASIPPRKYGRVSKDWPLIAQVEGDDKSLKELARQQVFPTSTGFRSFKTRFNENRYYWRKQLGYAILSHPVDVKEGLCWVEDAATLNETPLRLLSFTISPVRLSAGYSQLEFKADQQSPDSIVELIDNEFKFYSLGRYDIFLNLQYRGTGTLADGVIVPSGTVSIGAEFEPEGDLPGTRGVVEVLGLTFSNTILFQRTIPANIRRISHAGGSYNCSQVVLSFKNPLESIGWNRSFSLRSRPNVGTDVLKGILGRALVAKMKIFNSFAMDEGQAIELGLFRGTGYIALRSETNLI